MYKIKRYGGKKTMNDDEAKQIRESLIKWSEYLIESNITENQFVLANGFSVFFKKRTGENE